MKTNPKHEIFIKEMILHGDRLKAYRAAYPDAQKNSAINSSCELMQNTEIIQRIKEGQDSLLQKSADIKLEVLKQTGELQVKILKEQLASLVGMRDLIAEIIGGDIKSEKSYKMETTIEKIELRANIREIIQSLNLNFKILKSLTEGKGDYFINNTVFVNGEPFK